MLHLAKSGQRALIILVALATLIASCAEQDPYSDLQEMDLTQYNVPIVIKAPEGAVVETKDQVVQRDVTVKKGNDFSLQIFESEALTRDPVEIKKRLLREVQMNRYFQEIVSEDDNGFIYKNAIDSSYVNYGFRHFLIQGDKEYVFQTALRGKFTLDQVERMKYAVE